MALSRKPGWLGNLSPNTQKGVAGLLTLLILLLTVRAYFNKQVEEVGSSTQTLELEREWKEFLNRQRKVAADGKGDFWEKQDFPDREENFVLTYFDPNLVSLEQLLSFGIREKTAKTWLNYLRKNGHFYKKEDLKKLYGLSSRDYDRLSPFVVFKGKAASEFSNPVPQTASYPPKEKVMVELNTATEENLRKLPGIGAVLSERILKFRSALGGFFEIDQLREVYGLKDSTFTLIRNHVWVEGEKLKKINLNTATWADLTAHPYLRPLAKDILNARKSQKHFPDFESFRALNLINAEKYRKIAPYLTF